jgi:hypothetical protein
MMTRTTRQKKAVAASRMGVSQSVIAGQGEEASRAGNPERGDY